MAFSSALKLLIIEDNLPDYLIIRELLQDEHTQYQFEHAKSLTHARSILNAKSDFDVIFLDLTLPDSTGETLVLEIVRLASQTPVIVLTGHSDKKFGIDTLKLGVTDYLLKDDLSSFLLNKSISYAIERKKAFFDLKNSENKYKELFYANPQPLWVYDLETFKFLDVNDAAIRHYGYSRDEFLNMTIKDIRPSEEINDLLRMVERSKVYNEYASGAFKHTKKDGEVILVEIQSNSIFFEGRKARLILSHDVTEKIKNEESLKLSEQRFKALVQGGSDMVVISDLEGNYQYISPTLEVILGIKPRDVMGKNAFNFVHEDDRQKVRDNYSKIATQHRVHISPFRFKNGEGQWRWIESVVTNMMDDPAVGGIVTNSRDVTERINYIEAIQEQNSKLRDIAWTQSHVVRAPLARILGIVDLISHQAIDKENFPGLLNCLFTSATELDNIIKNIVHKTEEVNREEKDT